MWASDAWATELKCWRAAAGSNPDRYRSITYNKITGFVFVVVTVVLKKDISME